MKIPAVPSWWSDKWHDLPLVGGASEVPEFDGDTSLLAELQDRIELALTSLTPSEVFESVDYLTVAGGSIEHAALMAHEVSPWPVDDARLLLDAWKQPRKEVA